MLRTAVQTEHLGTFFKIIMLRTLDRDWSVLKWKYLYFTCSAKSNIGASLVKIFHVHHEMMFFCVAVTLFAPMSKTSCKTTVQPYKLVTGLVKKTNQKKNQTHCLTDAVRMQRTDSPLGSARPGLRIRTLTTRWLCCSVMTWEEAERKQTSVSVRSAAQRQRTDRRTTLSKTQTGVLSRTRAALWRRRAASGGAESYCNGNRQRLSFFCSFWVQFSKCRKRVWL